MLPKATHLDKTKVLGVIEVTDQDLDERPSALLNNCLMLEAGPAMLWRRTGAAFFDPQLFQCRKRLLQFDLIPENGANAEVGSHLSS
mmetsp:Transcript_12798/g.27608  ORF Transcript_12798/g.27608 Transcript_12798/m.27608 type:complete len:87 (-) Transcript_12798:44-304(-)